jgi:hypothetical protein
MSGSSNLIAAFNFLDVGPQSSYTLVMPTTDTDGNPLSDGLSCGIAFGDTISTLTLTGSFRHTPPITAAAGQVYNFIYSIKTNSWWNAS